MSSLDTGVASNRDIKFLTHIAKQAAVSWKLSGTPTLLGQSENLVFEVDGYILRLTEDRHRVASELEAELDFIAALSGKKIAVATPLLSVNGHYVESINDHHISLFKKAGGRVKTATEVFSSLETSHNLGRALGMMHAFSVGYRPKKYKRHAASNVIYHTKGAEFIHEDDHLALSEFHKAMKWIKGLPQRNDSYGLVHMDAHTSNFCVDDTNQVTLFDFDDCAYNFFAYDLAVPLNSLVKSNLPKDKMLAARSAFLRGYTEEYNLPSEWFDIVGGFMRFRSIELFAWNCMMYGTPTDNKGRIDFVDFYNLREQDFNRPYPVIRLKNWF